MEIKMNLLQHFLYVCFWALGFTLAHGFLNDKLLLHYFLPKVVRDRIIAEKAKNPSFRAMCAANGVAFMHALVVVPPSLIEGWRLFVTEPFEANSIIFEYTAIVMLGYFFWDICECYWNYSSYGLTFLLHGILSFVGLYVQVASTRCRMLGFTALFAASEMSTPFLHIRWFLLKAKASNGMYFQFCNWMFIFLFVSFRMVFLPLMVFPIFWRDCFVRTHVHNMSFARMAVQVFITIAWSLLNYYWGCLLVISQVKILFKTGKQTGAIEANAAAAKHHAKDKGKDGHVVKSKDSALDERKGGETYPDGSHVKGHKGSKHEGRGKKGGGGGNMEGDYEDGLYDGVLTRNMSASLVGGDLGRRPSIKEHADYIAKAEHKKDN